MDTGMTSCMTIPYPSCPASVPDSFRLLFQAALYYSRMADHGTIKTMTAESVADSATDATDVLLSQNGDGSAFERLVRRHQETISVQMWRFTRDQRLHEELVQNVFVEAWRSLRSFRGSAPFIHWLRKIAVRTGYAFWKERDSHRDEVTLDDGIAETLAAPHSTDARHAAEAVHAVLGKLPPRDRLVLTLLHLDGRSVAEAAQVLGWSQVMVKVQAWRARAKLKKLLEKLEEQ